jgi:hypothetical protein
VADQLNLDFPQIPCNFDIFTGEDLRLQNAARRSCGVDPSGAPPSTQPAQERVESGMNINQNGGGAAISAQSHRDGGVEAATTGTHRRTSKRGADMDIEAKRRKVSVALVRVACTQGRAPTLIARANFCARRNEAPRTP